MTDKPPTIVSSTFKPGGPVPAAWEVHAEWLLEALAGLRVQGRAQEEKTLAGLRVQGRAQEEKTLRNAFIVSSSMVAFHWAQQTVLGGRTDVSMADAFLGAAELLVRVVETVRPFLETRGLLERVTGERKSWTPGDSGEIVYSEGPVEVERLQLAELVYSEGPVEVERLRLDRFFGGEGLLEALLETVTVDGEAHELLVFDARLADLLDELGQAGWAAKVRSTPAEERGRRWIDLEKHKPLAAMAVCKAVWMRIQAERAARAARLERVPVPTMHALTARVAMGLPTGGNTAELRTRAPGIVAFEAGEWARLGGAAGVLAAVLAQRGHRQWVEGSRTADKVEILASKEELARMGLGNHDRPGETLAQLLELLSSCRLVAAGDPGNLSGALVLDWFVAERPRAGKAGRPSSVYVVTVGWPLMPTYTEAFAAERKLVLPRELRFYGPVLDPATCVLAGNRRTYQAQRLAWSIGAGQWLVSRREEYAERGGVQLDTLRPFLTGMGLYHRSHASLADEVGEAWRRKPVQLELGGPKEPLLVPTGDGLFRLGPDYKEQEKLILAGADLTDRKRAAARQSNKVRRGDVRRKRTDKGPDGV